MYGNDASTSALADALEQEASALTAVRDGVSVDAAAVEAVAAVHSSWAPYAASLADLAEDYNALAEEQGAVIAIFAERDGLLYDNIVMSWVGGDRYRDLHRAYGTMIAERRVLGERYERIRGDLQAHVTGQDAAALPESGRQQVVPAYFRKLELGAQRMEIRDMVAGVGDEP